MCVGVWVCLCVGVWVGVGGWVWCVWVCPVRFFHTVTNQPRRLTDRLKAAIDLIKTWVFRKRASSQSYRIRVESTSAPASHFACPRWRTSVYIKSRDVALDHVVL